MTDSPVAPSDPDLRILRLLKLIGANLHRFDRGRLEAELQRLATDAGLNVQELGFNPREFLYLVLLRKDLDQPLGQLTELSERTKNLLRRRVILTVEDLLEHSEAELLRQTNFGPDSLEEVKEYLAGFGWHLSPHDQELPDPPPGDEWVHMSPTTEHARYVLRSRLHRAAIHDLEELHHPDYRILRHLEKRLNIARVGQLVATSRAWLLAADWKDIRTTMAYVGESDADPGQFAVERLEHLLNLYGLSLPD